MHLFSTQNIRKPYIGKEWVNSFFQLLLLRKSVRSRSYSGPYFPALGLNTERYATSLRIQSECRKMRTGITPNTDTFYSVFWR